MNIWHLPQSMSLKVEALGIRIGALFFGETVCVFSTTPLRFGSSGFIDLIDWAFPVNS